jgi:hypothetical protein
MGRKPKSARRTVVVSEIRHTLGTQPSGAFQRVESVRKWIEPRNLAAGES